MSPFARVPFGVPTVDGRNPAPLRNHGKPIVCWYLQGIIIPGFPGRCRISSIHSIFDPLPGYGGDDGPEVPCHRAVLAASSAVFERMLQSDMREGAEQTSSGVLSSLRSFGGVVL